jgi:hypothetical protein
MADNNQGEVSQNDIPQHIIDHPELILPCLNEQQVANLTDALMILKQDQLKARDVELVNLAALLPILTEDFIKNHRDLFLKYDPRFPGMSFVTKGLGGKEIGMVSQEILDKVENEHRREANAKERKAKIIIREWLAHAAVTPEICQAWQDLEDTMYAMFSGTVGEWLEEFSTKEAKNDTMDVSDR